MKYLVEIAIGPVQEFIASARKLRDLWFGSTLLSELSKCVAKSLHDQKCALIFPAPKNDADLEFGSSLVVANKILAEYEGDDPRVVVTIAKENWRKKLKDISEETLEYVETSSFYKKMRVKTDLFRKQIEDFGEFFAAWVPLREDYGKSRHEVEKLLAGRKNLREFSAPNWDGYGIPKSSLDGLRESVICDDKFCIPGLLKRNEKLDAVGLVKRFWPLLDKKNIKKFEDLAAISSVSWFNKIANDTQATHLRRQFELLFKKRDNYPVEAIYEESKKAATWEEYDCVDSRKACSILRDINKIVGAPQKYSCVLLGDGDNMGAAIDQIKSKDGFQKFTQDLSQFADKVKNIVDKNGGCLIYAGGDDVMAFAPMETALNCANELRKAFAETMAPICIQQGISKNPTLSIGMAIVHHSEPLSNALDYARGAEKMAKNVDGKNALAVSQNKRSGAPLVVSGKWEPEGVLLGLFERLQNMIFLYKSEGEVAKLPSRLGYQLREASIAAGDSLKFERNGEKLVPMNAQSALVLRIFSQKQNAETQEQTISDKLTAKLLLGQTSIRDLSDELVIARQFAGADNEG